MNVEDDATTGASKPARTKVDQKKRAAREKVSTAKETAAKKSPAIKAGSGLVGRTREARPYPAAPFEESLTLADAIQKFASGERVRRLTLLREMDRSPNSGATKMLITNSGKYGLTTGSYAAEWLELTELGNVASSTDVDPPTKIDA
jgi:hypothetical protein